MPIYEYRCNNCRRRVSLLLRGFSDTATPICPSCGGSDLRRLVSSFAVLKSEERLFEDLAEPGKWGDVDENDPKSVARWAKRMGKEMGEDLGTEFDEMVERLETGEMPEGEMGREEEAYGEF